MRLRLRLLAAALLGFTACSDASGPQAEVLGTYSLTMLRNEALPARASCGGYQVEFGAVTLGPGRTASFQQRLAGINHDAVITLNAAGQYRADGNIVTLTLDGRWSHITQAERMQVHFLIVGDGKLARMYVGAECDASDTEIYERGLLPTI